MRKSKILAILLSFFCVIQCVFGTTVTEAAVATKSWSVYYVTGGGNGTSTIVEIATYGDPYTAICDGFTGDCTYMAVTIKAYEKANRVTEIALNRTVAFSRAASVQFELTRIPAQEDVYFGVDLSYQNGNTARASGSINIQ